MTLMMQITLTAYFTLAVLYGFVYVSDNLPKWVQLTFTITTLSCMTIATVGTYATIWLI